MFEQHVRQRIEAVLSNTIAPENLTGATSVRCSVGLVLGRLEGITTLSERDAWDYLDRENVILTNSLITEYGPRVSEWTKRQQRTKS